MEIDGIVPLRAHYGEEEAPFAAEARRVLTEIASVGHLLQHSVLPNWAQGTLSLSVHSLRGSLFEGLPEDQKRRISSTGPSRHSAFAIRLRGEVEPVDVERDDPGAISYWQSVVVALAHDLVAQVLYAAHVAAPGSLSLLDGHWLADDRTTSGSPAAIADQLAFASTYAKKTGWPALLQLEFPACWNWINRNGLSVRAGDTPVSRAYSAYTHLLPSPEANDDFQLIRVLHGVEALFCSSPSGVMNQVAERSQLLLGMRKHFKRDLGKMYEVRSALVHGALGFPPLGFPYERPKGYSSRADRLGKGLELAAALLVASLQRLVERDWSGIAFPATAVEKPIEFDYDRADAGFEFVRFRAGDLTSWFDEQLLEP